MDWTLPFILTWALASVLSAAFFALALWNMHLRREDAEKRGLTRAWKDYYYSSWVGLALSILAYAALLSYLFAPHAMGTTVLGSLTLLSRPVILLVASIYLYKRVHYGNA